MNLPPIPKFEKKHHHIVPVLWQKRFKAPSDPGPYYLNVGTGQKLPPQGPGDKMSEEYANIVFDEFFRPSDALEDHLGTLETKMVTGLDRCIQKGELDSVARVDVAMLMAVQVCRYPENFGTLLDLGKYLAIALTDYKNCPDAVTLNRALQAKGLLSGARITQQEFVRLQQAQGSELLASELEFILAAHGYEFYFNPKLVIAAATQVANHLLGLEWTLLHSSTPSFILSDRPVPSTIGYGFSIGLSASYALKLDKPTTSVTNDTIHSQNATPQEISQINLEVKSRAKELICGPGAWVHRL
ncbi:DUF4238 domain-containing protein [Gluconacetobacter aggeris]|uniref:DUF4238 domain-containing protein n=2 Tax=Acetobacteraceae TaxID=433 RepID=A0A7W4ISK9_9PROT|nr:MULTISPECIES: DUF4238 domain-containing protein [Acetobacteraceae]MBB2168158.1 DUF4238 domain-containing protein [Gluconacetobacter aggeris]NVN37479.1 DUF4238 domain-containing protein [Komagataeibacter swingsii]